MARDKVSEHIAAIRRRCEEAQEFAGLAIAMTSEPHNDNAAAENMLQLVEGNIAEARAILFSGLKECDEIRSFLGIPRR
jgi:hypothetical protein